MTESSKETGLFGGKHLKLGIWGLGRGSSFINSARALGIDIVAGCDISPTMRKNFKNICPEAEVVEDEDEFFKMDFDAVLIATFFPDHAKHTIKALKAGKHVLCEVTSFLTPAQGVELVEAVEASGLVYNLAENYPFDKKNLYLAKLYKEGFFGELEYAEFEYIHGGTNACLNTQDTLPGNRLHHWRGWLNYHYYCTHSLGPAMVITGLRPEKVVAFPTDVLYEGAVHGKGRKVDGIMPNLCAMCPSLIYMSNGGIVRNLMGGTSADGRNLRLFGTRAAAEAFPYDGVPLTLKVGAMGDAHFVHVEPDWPGQGEIAERAGHGGGDFWELYYFAREILMGEKAPWNVYAAADVTLAGIQALRSAVAEGQPMEVPDFRKKEVRDRYRNDNWVQNHIDPDRIFPDDQNLEITKNFCDYYKAAMPYVKLLRITLDAMKVFGVTKAEDKINTINRVKELRAKLPAAKEALDKLRSIYEAYPESQGGIAIKEKLAVCEASRLDDLAAFDALLKNFLIEA